MNKNSILKKLLAIGVGTVCVTTGALFAACNDKKKDDDKDPGTNPPAANHSHQWSTGTEATAWGKNATHHWRLCLADGHGTQGQTDAQGYGTHDWSDAQDTTCDTCGYVRTISGGGDTPTPSQKEFVEVDFSAGPNYSANDPLKAGLGITVGKNYDTSGETTKRNVDFQGVKSEVTGRLKLGGKISKTAALVVNLPQAGTVIVYGSAGTSSKSAHLTMLNSEGTEIEGARQQVAWKTDSSNAYAAVFHVEANTTYYIGSDFSANSALGIAADADGANATVHKVAVVYEATLTETKTPVEAKAAGCETDGNVAYTKTEYGRYLNGEQKLVSAGDVVLGKLGHSYAPDYATLTVPAADNTGEKGSVTLKCGRDSSHTKNVELNYLNSGDYATDDAGQETGKTKYSITLEGTLIEFVANKVAALEYEFVALHQNLFDTTQDLGLTKANATTLDTGLKGYGNTNNSTELSAWDTNYKVSTDAGVLTVLDASTKATNAYIVFDEAKTTGVYKINGIINLHQVKNSGTTTTSKWNAFQLISSDGGTDADTFAVFRTNDDKNLCLSQQSIDSSTGKAAFVNAGTPYTYAAQTDYAFEIEINLDTNTVSLKICLASSVDWDNPVYSGSTSVADVAWKGIRLQTGDSASRTLLLKEFSISERRVKQS